MLNTNLINLKPTFFILLVAAHILFAASISQAQPYQTISVDNSIVGGDLSRTVTTIQSGNIALNRFQMTSVKKTEVPDNALKGVVLLLPPLGSGFRITKSEKTATTIIHLLLSSRVAILPSSVSRPGSTVLLLELARVAQSIVRQWLIGGWPP